MTLEIIEQPTTLEVVGGDTSLITLDQTTVLGLSEGPPGPQGEPGPPGADGDPGPPGPAGSGMDPVLGYIDLRAIPSLTLTVFTQIRVVVRQVGSTVTGSGWFLAPGTLADDNDTILRPDDYAASTNEKIWVKVWGY